MVVVVSSVVRPHWPVELATLLPSGDLRTVYSALIFHTTSMRSLCAST